MTKKKTKRHNGVLRRKADILKAISFWEKRGGLMALCYVSALRWVMREEEWIMGLNEFEKSPRGYKQRR